MSQHAKTRLNVLFLASWFPNKGIPTLGNFILRHAQAVNEFHNVHVLYVCKSSDNSSTFVFDESNTENIKTLVVYYPQSMWPLFGKIAGFYKGLRKLTDEKKLQFDIIHANVLWKDGWMAATASRKLRIPFVLTEHWTGYHEAQRGKLKGWQKRYLIRMAKKASVIMPVSKDLATAMQSFGIKNKYTVIPNVVNTDIFHFTEKHQKPYQFLHISTLNDEHKNISGILKTWKKAYEKRQDIHLKIGGDGPVEEWRQFAHSIGIYDDSITFFGEKKWEEIALLMNESHCLIQFSNYENLPCVIVESLSSGNYVISTNVGGIPEYINSSNGILIAKQDEQALLSAILEMPEKSILMDRKKLSEDAKSIFSMKQIGRQISDVYLSVLKESIQVK
ncbi:MAG: glycosyltransferase [Flavobacteriales bacterium]|jgi:glycosyltransferase involved in cell wall biosynthesis